MTGLEFPLTGKPRIPVGKRAHYVPNHRSFGAFMKSEQMRDATAEVAQDIAITAAGKTPTGQDGTEHRGLHARVRAGFRVRREAGLIKVGGNLRVRVDVFNEEDGAGVVEFGARGLPRSRPLGEAGAAFGDFKPEDGPL